MSRTLISYIKEGRQIPPETVLKIAHETETDELYRAAAEITESCAPRKFDLCSIKPRNTGWYPRRNVCATPPPTRLPASAASP